MKTKYDLRKIFYKEKIPATLIEDRSFISLLRCNHGPLAILRPDASSVTLIARDQSNTVLSTSKAQHRQNHAYTPYGYSLPTDDCPIGHNGELIDLTLGGYPLGQGFRFYLQRLGRFGAADTVPPFTILNPYAYCENDPINAVDPSGHAKVFMRSPKKFIQTTVITEYKQPSLLTNPKTRSQASKAINSLSELENLVSLRRDAKNPIDYHKSKLQQYGDDLDYALGDSRGWKYEQDLRWNIKYHKKELIKARSSADATINVINNQIREILPYHNSIARNLGLTPFTNQTSLTSYISTLNAQLRATRISRETVQKAPFFY